MGVNYKRPIKKQRKGARTNIDIDPPIDIDQGDIDVDPPVDVDPNSASPQKSTLPVDSDTTAADIDLTTAAGRKKVLPFPTRKVTKDPAEKKFQLFVKMLQGLNVSIPFTEALHEMPSYVRFLKDILGKK